MREVFIILTEMDEASSDGEVRFYFTALAKQASGSAAEIRGMYDIISLASIVCTLAFLFGLSRVLLLPCNRQTSDSPSYPFLLPLPSFLFVIPWENSAKGLARWERFFRLHQGLYFYTQSVGNAKRRIGED